MTNFISPESLLLQYENFNRIVTDIMKTVGFISGGFCPEPCEHTTLQHTNPQLYNDLMIIWNDYHKEMTHLLTLFSLRDDPEARKKYLLPPEVFDNLDQ